MICISADKTGGGEDGECVLKASYINVFLFFILSKIFA